MQVLEKIYHQFFYFFSNCLNLILSILKILIQSKLKVNFPPAKSDQCIILGNGPSLKQSLENERNFLLKYPLICVNSFSLTKEYTDLKPAYYVMHDPGLWLSESTLTKDIFNSITENTSWNLTLFIPRSARKSTYLNKIQSANPNIKVKFYNYTIYKGFEKIGFKLYKLNLAMPQSQNVLVASIFLCVNLGFKKIFILGADHTWHQDIIVDENNVLCTRHIHFYDSKETVNIKPFYKGLHLKETFRMHEIYTAWAKVFFGYTVLYKYAKHRNSKIYNASEVSFIDAFERKTLS